MKTLRYGVIITLLGLLILGLAFSGLGEVRYRIVCKSGKIVSDASQCDTPGAISIPVSTGFGDLLTIFGALILIFGIGLIVYGFKDKIVFSTEKEERSKKPPDLKTRISEKPVEEEYAGDEAIAVSNLSLSHKGIHILKSVNFVIKPKQVTIIVGGSGSGKSTIIECIAGRLKPNSGSITILGKNTQTHRQEINRLVGFVPQHPELNMGSTVWQNVADSALRWGIENAEEKIQAILEEVGLENRKDVKAKSLSGGQQKLLSISMELVRKPKLLLLDEPTTGLDPSTRSQIVSILSRLVTEHKITVIMTTHFMDEAEEADEVIIVGKGGIIAKGEPFDLKRKMPGQGKIVVAALERVEEKIIKGISAAHGVIKVITEGRVLRIVMDSPNAVMIGQSIHEAGGMVEEVKVERASMKDVFVYYTGEKIKE